MNVTNTSLELSRPVNALAHKGSSADFVGATYRTGLKSLRKKVNT